MAKASKGKASNPPTMKGKGEGKGKTRSNRAKPVQSIDNEHYTRPSDGKATPLPGSKVAGQSSKPRKGRDKCNDVADDVLRSILAKEGQLRYEEAADVLGGMVAPELAEFRPSHIPGVVLANPAINEVLNADPSPAFRQWAKDAGIETPEPPTNWNPIIDRQAGEIIALNDRLEMSKYRERVYIVVISLLVFLVIISRL